ncbi:MAG: arylamine N-acetyltransferase [Halolamina sp.]|uniref:arylamine N-acetyltransferase family protein n=1 Tax=Halolamina sp. TaxID=1940283 RepID=UPI002FC3D633
METTAYLERIGFDERRPSANRTQSNHVDTELAPTLETAGRLQRAHAQAVPFENLDIVGDPFDADPTPPAGVQLNLPHLYQKIVERERGGFCFELNGLFTWLLRELGFDADRVAARMVGDDGTGRPPANHHTIAVEFDRRYLLDVGTGAPQLRRPLPIDGEVVVDDVGVAWRVVESERPDEEFLTQYRLPEGEWEDRYLFTDRPRELSYFEATCEYLASAPESPFTGAPVATIATEYGYQTLRTDSLIRWTGGDEREEPVEPDEWHGLFQALFGRSSR